ncbi:MAG: DUF4143 domain-containing protein [Eggerthellaceae bacterium]|nr:DUF4143 domain-containing protein [Eggerthellaceae bacterium]
MAKGAVLVEGPKWCGKTTTSMRVAKSVLFMQDPATRSQNLNLAEVAPQLLLEGEVPRLIDEWQIAPELWDAVRFVVDERDEFGQFILTGSSVPPDMSQISHTGTGRIARMRMGTMSLMESMDSTGDVSLKSLFDGENLPITKSEGSSIEEIAFLICRGGWPASIGYSERIGCQQAIDYVDAIVETDISRVDGIRRNPDYARNIMQSYARSCASQASLSSMLADLKMQGISMGETTFNSYIEALRKLFVIEDLRAWNPNLRSRTAIRTAPTHFFTDPSIAAASLGTSPEELLNDLNTLGLLFESLCIRDLRAYAQALDGKICHYRDKSDLECDAVVRLRNGKYGLIEIKLGGESAIDKGARNLLKLASKIDTGKMPEPSFLMVLIGVGQFSYPRKDGVYVVPVKTLGV